MYVPITGDMPGLYPQ